MLYRLYAPQDFDVLYALEKVCFEPPFRFSRGTMRYLIQSPNTATWIAEEQGRMVGFAIVVWTKPKSRAPSDGPSLSGSNAEVSAYIQTIEVAPEARRRGVGRQLLAHIEGSARAAGARLIGLHVEAENSRATRLYEAQGYICRGKRENYYPQGRAALVYVKPLDSGAGN